MSRTVLCPVCQGNGKIYDSVQNIYTTCNGCNGKGWIEINDYNPVCPYPHFPKRPHYHWLQNRCYCVRCD